MEDKKLNTVSKKEFLSAFFSLKAILGAFALFGLFIVSYVLISCLCN